jgi:mono/diheme cytochrome c family protein
VRRLPLIALSVLLAGFALSVLTGCGSARRGAPVQDHLVVTERRLVAGQEVFMTYCHQCHPGGEAGLAPTLNDKPIPGFLIRFQVRNGLGAMPSFGRDLISDQELDDLVAYVVTLRRHGG